MFGSQLASLLLLSLSLSSNLSDAVRPREELLELLRQATDFNEVYNLFRELGEEFKIYADLRVISKHNCTPDRILFPTNVWRWLGLGAQRYVTKYVNLQRQICRLTFVNRLRHQFAEYNDDWPGKEHFEEFLSFVNPWPEANSDMYAFIDSIKTNVQEYVDWRVDNPRLVPRVPSREEVLGWLGESSTTVEQMFAGFVASLKCHHYFQPELSYELERALLIGKIAELTCDSAAE